MASEGGGKEIPIFASFFLESSPTSCKDRVSCILASFAECLCSDK